MEMSWLEVLSSVDKMVLGSLVSSIVLSFVLLVVIFSMRIQSLHGRIGGLRASLEAQKDEIDRQQKHLEEYARQMEDDRTIMAHYREVESGLNQELETLKATKEQLMENASELRKKITQLQADKTESSRAYIQVQSDLKQAKEEIGAVLKRNEFWVEQLAQLRTKHDALVLKLRRMEHHRS
jgi:chromosome segregation ATPase